MAATEVEFSKLASYLSGLTAGTYQLNVTGLTASVMGDAKTEGTFGYKIYKSTPSSVYLDLSETTLPSVTSLKYCFRHCTQLVVSPKIPDSVTTMESCFASCTSLVTTPIIPDSVTSLSECFEYCSSLTTVSTIGKSVKYMGYCFRECTSLVSVSDIPDSVTNIDYTFLGCTALVTPPKLSNSAKDLTYAFEQCSSLETAPEIPNSVTTMEGTFFSCTSLKAAPEIPESVINLESSFRECSSLETINDINCTSVSMRFSFGGCTSLPKDLVVNLNNVTDMTGCFENDSFDNLTINGNSLVVASVPAKNLIINCETLTPTLGSNKVLETCSITCNKLTLSSAFKNCTKLTAVSFEVKSSDSITADYCFQNCTSLVTSPKLPDTVTSMNYCFHSCTALTTVIEIPNSVTNMSYCFYSCKSLLKTPNLSTSVTNISYCFYGCTALTEITEIPNFVTNMSYCFCGCTALTIVPDLPESITDVSSCFASCTSLITVPKIPSSLINISGFFYNCTALNLIKFWNYPKSDVITTYSNAFYNCTALEHIYVHNTTQETNLETFLTKIQKASTNNFPSSLTVADIVSPYWYYIEGMDILFDELEDFLQHSDNNTSETSYKITISDLNEEDIGSSETKNTLGYKLANYLRYMDLRLISLPDVTDLTKCFSQCSELVYSPVLPEDAVILNNCFNGCSSLTVSPILPSTVTDMSYCFQNCTSLSSVLTIPSKVTELDYCFSGTAFAETPTIPSSVIDMTGTFSDCTSLLLVTNVPNKVTALDSCFQNCSSLLTVNEYNPSLNATHVGEFTGCSNLESIYLTNDFEGDEWSIFDIKFTTEDTTEYATITIYNTSDSDNPISVEKFAVTSDEKLLLGSYTDDLTYSPNNAITEDLIYKIIQHKAAFTMDTTKADPEGNTFMLIAKDPEKVATNLLLSKFVNDLSISDFDLSQTKLSEFVNDLSISDFDLSQTKLSEFINDLSISDFDLSNTKLSEFVNDLSLSSFTNDLKLSNFTNDLSLSNFTNDLKVDSFAVSCTTISTATYTISPTTKSSRYLVTKASAAITISNCSTTGVEIIIMTTVACKVTYNNYAGTSTPESMVAGTVKRLFAVPKGYIVNHYDAVWN